MRIKQIENKRIYQRVISQSFKSGEGNRHQINHATTLIPTVQPFNESFSIDWEKSVGKKQT